MTEKSGGVAVLLRCTFCSAQAEVLASEAFDPTRNAPHTYWSMPSHPLRESFAEGIDWTCIGDRGEVLGWRVP